MKMKFYAITFILLAFPLAYADFGNSTTFKLVADTSAYAEAGNSTSYRAFVESALSADSSNSSSHRMTLGLLAPFIPVRAGESLSARLDFVDQIRTGNQTLSVIVTDNVGNLIAGAIVNGTVMDPNGARTVINFTETASGNYTRNFTLSKIGDHTIQVSVSKTGFANISSSKSIYVGLVKFTDFTSDSQVFQGNAIAFRYTVKNTGNANSTIIPILSVYNSAGSLVFSKSGFSQTLTGNQSIPLLQHNIMTWSVGSAAAGTYNATGNIVFTDPDDKEALTSNRSVLFNVVATPSAPSAPAPSVGGGRVLILNQTINQTLFIQPPRLEFLQFTNIPVLIEMFPGEQKLETMILFNPLDVDVSDASATIEGLSPEWFLVLDSQFSIGIREERIFTVLFNIPRNALPGNYQGKLRLQSNDLARDFFFILRVKPLEQVLETDSFITKAAEIKELKKETHFVIQVKNKEKPLESLSIVERIDKSIASHVGEIVFSQQPSRIIQPDPVVEFTLIKLAPFEERNISYYVRKVVNTTVPFILSSIEQVSTVEKIPKIEEKIDEMQTMLILIISLIALILIVLYLRGTERVRREVKELEKIIVRVES